MLELMLKPPFIELGVLRFFDKEIDTIRSVILQANWLSRMGLNGLPLFFCATNLKDRYVLHKDPRPTGADQFSRAVARIGWRPCRPGLLTSSIVKFLTKIRDQREQATSAER